MATRSLDAGMTTLRTLWGSISMSIVIMGGLDAHLRSTGAGPKTTPDPTVLAALTGAAVVTGVVSLVLPAKMYAASRKAAGVRSYGPPSDDELAKRLPMFQTAFLLGLALSESVAIFGLVVGRLGGEHLHSLGLFAASLVLALTKFPTRASIAAEG